MTQTFFVTVSSQYRTGHLADPILIHFSRVGINVLTLSGINFKICLIIPSYPKNSHSTWSSQNFVRISHLPLSVPRSVRLHIIPHSHNDAAYKPHFLWHSITTSKVARSWESNPAPGSLSQCGNEWNYIPWMDFKPVFPRFARSECTF